MFWYEIETFSYVLLWLWNVLLWYWNVRNVLLLKKILFTYIINLDWYKSKTYVCYVTVSLFCLLLPCLNIYFIFYSLKLQKEEGWQPPLNPPNLKRSLNLRVTRVVADGQDRGPYSNCGNVTLQFTYRYTGSKLVFRWLQKWIYNV